MAITHAGIPIGKHPLLVGVINISPESFYKGSVATADSSLEAKIQQFHQYGVDCLDVGAMSTRPLDIYGGERASINKEKERVNKLLPPLMEIAQSYEIPVALDTQYSEVAKIGIEAGISVINDISGLKTDPQMAPLLANTSVDLVIMATEEKPGDVCGIEPTISALADSLSLAMDAGIEREKIVIDPGFGGWQGRGADCDLHLLRNFDRFHEFNLPIYIGISRKSTIQTLHGGTTAEDRLAGSLVLTNWLVERGAQIIRTHDVKETRLALNVVNSLQSL